MLGGYLIGGIKMSNVLKTKFLGKEIYLLLAASLALLLFTFLTKDISGGMNVVSILEAIGIVNPPSWLVWTIIGAGSISLIVGALTTFGLATVPSWAAKALLAADGFGL